MNIDWLDLLDMNSEYSGLPTWFAAAGGYLTFIAGLGFIYKAYIVMRRPNRRQAKVRDLEAIVNLIAACYPIGMAFKLWVVGPDIVRWHLTDFGFAVTVSILLFHAPKPPEDIDAEFLQNHPWYIKGSDNWNPLPYLDYRAETYAHRRFFIGLTLALSYCYEVMVGAMYRFLATQEQEPYLVGDFEWLDMLAYTLGAAIAMWCLTRVLKYYRAEHDILQTEEAAALEASHQQEEPPRQAKTSRPQRPPRRADGTQQSKRRRRAR